MEIKKYEKGFAEWAGEIDNEVNKAAESFVKIGYLLKVARDTPILEGSGYENINDFAKKRYGMDKTQVSRFIHINDRFSEGGYSDRLQTEYKGFGHAKLTIMLQLPDVINEELSPNYSKSEIQAIKEEVEEENKITGIEVLLEGQDKVQEELNSDIGKIIDQIGEDIPELFINIHNLLEPNKEYDMKKAIEVMAPTGEKTYTARIRGVGRKMLILRDTENEAKIIDIRSNEKTTCTWKDIMDAWVIRMDPEMNAEENWEDVYGKEYQKEEEKQEQPKTRKQSKVTKAVTKKEVAPVQQNPQSMAAEQEQIPGQMNIDDYPELKQDVDKKVDNLPSETTENIEKTESDTDSSEKLENVDKIAEIVQPETEENVEKTESDVDLEEKEITSKELREIKIKAQEIATGLKVAIKVDDYEEALNMIEKIKQMVELLKNVEKTE